LKDDDEKFHSFVLLFILHGKKILTSKPAILYAKLRCKDEQSIPFHKHLVLVARIQPVRCVRRL
jgi:hypothetical protein